MNRRRLIALLGLGVLTAPLGAAARPEKTLDILDTGSAGYRHYQPNALLNSIQAGDTLSLKRQPDNPYDDKAIEVYWQERKIGYVPRHHNSALSRLMDEGNRVTARVTGLERDHWMPVRFGVGVVVG